MKSDNEIKDDGKDSKATSSKKRKSYNQETPSESGMSWN